MMKMNEADEGASIYSVMQPDLKHSKIIQYQDH